MLPVRLRLLLQAKPVVAEMSRATSYIANIFKHSKRFDRVMREVNIVSVGEGKCKAEFTVTPETTNEYCTMHGGFTATLVDCVSTLALASNETVHPGVSVDLRVTYMKAAKEGDEVLVDAWTVKTGRNLAFLDVELKNKLTGDLLARGSHIKFIGMG